MSGGAGGVMRHARSVCVLRACTHVDERDGEGVLVSFPRRLDVRLCPIAHLVDGRQEQPDDALHGGSDERHTEHAPG